MLIKFLKVSISLLKVRSIGGLSSQDQTSHILSVGATSLPIYSTHHHISYWSGNKAVSLMLPMALHFTLASTKYQLMSDRQNSLLPCLFQKQIMTDKITIVHALATDDEHG